MLDVIRTAALIVLLTFAVQARADDCEDNQAAMNRCAAVELARLDRQLNETFKNQLAWLQDARKKLELRSAQRQWIAFRDADCLYQVGKLADAGTLGPMLQARCLAAHTEARVRQLQAYTACRQQGCPR
ncbi:lysozyme inhibitor LprI family protein [Pseudomonas sp. 21LCFQ010]|uniref:lysozyme inhibitor LprI family protein n=1 Tax=Pseudomonas sp. 21LCFQ010 TaxID=2957506 RepID=UPI002097F1B1|nr:lysozyme inhibitor LprI family protein [Pseudomonas sp. 21LCFQ010]MCO8160619.1 lysozyme inhibitor LprI family protein [Pseudomonas sp. 21LCFQ010]